MAVLNQLLLRLFQLSITLHFWNRIIYLYFIMLLWNPIHQFCSFKAGYLIIGSFFSFSKNGRSSSFLPNLWILLESATKNLWWFSFLRGQHLYWVFFFSSTCYGSLLHKCLQLSHPLGVVVKFEWNLGDNLLCRIFFTLFRCLHFCLPFYVEFRTEEIYLGKVTILTN